MHSRGGQDYVIDCSKAYPCICAKLTQRMLYMQWFTLDCPAYSVASLWAFCSKVTRP